MFKRTAISAAAASALLTAVLAHAQDTQRVEITGSSIKRTDAETALPVTIIRVEELSKLGITTAEQALQRISSNQSNIGVTSSVGATTGGKAEADLRGLSGPTGSNANKTLVLLNGRRLANHSFDAAAVDLNAIPLAAVDRIEVLRDGASSTYGTDAIGGVINFVLRRDFRGIEVSASALQPEAGSAGASRRGSVVAGFGSLTEDRFNVIAALDWRKQRALKAASRSFSKSGILGPSRQDIIDGTSGTSFPGDLDGFEPSAPNCAPPGSVPVGTAADASAFGSCRYDFSRDVDSIPENEQLTALVRGSIAVAPDHTLSAEFLRANNKSTSRVAAAPTSSLIQASSPFFPGGAPVRDLDELIPFFGVDDPNPSGPTLGGSANWRQVPAGNRTSGDDTTTTRFLVELEGLVGGFDYRAAIGRSENKSIASVKGGYVNDGLIQQGVWNGVINPFGEQTAEGLSAVQAAQVAANTLIGKSTLDFVDLRFSKDLMRVAAGTVTAAFGIEHRREKSSFEATDITAELGSLGIDPDSDTAGKRHSTGIFAELGVPLLKTLDLTLAARYDKYNDFGSTFNPKVSLRFQPMKNLVVRGSFSTGFRAPTLYEIYQPQALSYTTDNYDDPLLCPGGVPVAGASEGVVCGQQVLKRDVGPVGNGQAASELDPEKSKSYSVGLVFEPLTNLNFTVDYWQLKIKNLISGLPEQEIFQNSGRYSSRFVRCSQIAAGQIPGVQLGAIDACANLSATQDPIAYIDSPAENLGELHVNGIDLSANWRSGASSLGRFSVGIDGTYITKYKYQRERGGQFIDAAGRYSDNAPVFRWQHVLSAGWQYGSWSGTVAQRFKSGYTDQGGDRKVTSYTLHDLSVSFSGVKGLVLTAGVLNIFDREPPKTVQVSTFQRGYDPRFTDPLGRTFLIRGNYAF